jgi:hypothetical protein
MGKRWGCKDFFYDMANTEMVGRRAAHLAKKAKDHGYDGVFFDWGSGWHSLVENGYTFLTDRFRKRHPRAAYDDGVDALLKTLRATGCLIVTNGACRSPGGRLALHADIDIVESMFTADASTPAHEVATSSGETKQACETWFNGVEQAVRLAGELPAIVRSRNPRVRFLFLNYACPFARATGRRRPVAGGTSPIFDLVPDRQAIHYGVAMAYLGNASGFTCGPDVSLSLVRDPVYFARIGAPVDGLVRKGEGTYLRRFTSGLVAVSQKEAVIEAAVPRNVTRVTDLYTGRPVTAVKGRVRLILASERYLSGETKPIGRVFVYEH